MAIYRGSGGSVEGIIESDIVTVAITQGGTGAKTAAAARTNLGLGTAAITDSSAYATAAQGTLAASAVQPTDIGTAAAKDITFFASAAQGTLADSALQSDDIGVSVQAYDAQLTDVAGLTATDNGVIIGNGSNFVVESGSTLRSSLGLAIGTDVLAPNGSAASLTDFPTFNQNTTGTAANVSGVVAIANGGTGQTTAATARAALLPTYATNGGKVLAVKADASDVEYITVSGSGSVTSVDMSVPTGLSVSGNPVTSAGTLAVTYASGYAIPTTAKQTEWDTAYTDRNKWDGGATGLTAATGRTSLGLGTAATTDASDYLTAANPSYTGTLTGGTGVVNLGSGQFYKDASGNVGIGTSTPDANSKLDVAGISQASSASYASFQLYNSGLASNAYFRIAYDAANNLVFNNVNNAYSSSTEFMRIGSSGNVGIGTSSPTNLLTVQTAGTGTTAGSNIIARLQANASGRDATLLISDNVANSATVSMVGGAFAVGQNGVETLRVDASSNFKFNSGYGSVATAYGCRAWVNFNATTSGGTGGYYTVRGSGNVSSVLDGGSATHTVNYATAMPDTNYAAHASVGSANNTNFVVAELVETGLLTTSTTYTTGYSTTKADSDVNCFIVFR